MSKQEFKKLAESYLPLVNPLYVISHVAKYGGLLGVAVGLLGRNTEAALLGGGLYAVGDILVGSWEVKNQARTAALLETRILEAQGKEPLPPDRGNN